MHTFDATYNHILPVVGLYVDVQTKVSVALSSGETKVFMIKSAPIPKQNVTEMKSIMTSMDYFGTDLMFLSPADKQYPVAFDYKGDLRWMLNVNTMFDVKRLKNGNIITGSHRYSRMPYCSTGLVEMTMVGKIVKEYRMPGNSHHDQWELRDGNIMALTQDYSEGKSTVEDMIALLERETGKVLRTWDFKDFLPQNVGGSGSQDAHDWFHNNALWVDEDKKEIILSGRHQDAIACFNYEGNGLSAILKVGHKKCKNISSNLWAIFQNSIGSMNNMRALSSPMAILWLLIMVNTVQKSKKIISKTVITSLVVYVIKLIQIKWKSNKFGNSVKNGGKTFTHRIFAM